MDGRGDTGGEVELNREWTMSLWQHLDKCLFCLGWWEWSWIGGLEEHEKTIKGSRESLRLRPDSQHLVKEGVEERAESEEKKEKKEEEEEEGNKLLHIIRTVWWEHSVKPRLKQLPC